MTGASALHPPTWLSRLTRLSEALAHVATRDRAARVVLEQAARLPGVVRGGLALAAAGGRELRFVAMHDETVGADRLPWCVLDAAADVPVVEVTRTGRPMWASTLQELRARYPGVADRQATFGARAFAVLPLVGEAEPVGALMLCFAETRPFDGTERAFLEAFAAQAYQALQRAGQHQDREETAALLQRSLLPTSLPELSGLALGAQYAPAEAESGVGGDWFDVVALADGSALLVIGDVMGRGVPAATVMGQLRAAVRAYALLDPSPAVLLQRLDALVAAFSPPDELATVLVGLVDPARTSLQLSTAGHPPPLLARPGSPAAPVPLPTGPPLGIGQALRQEHTVPLLPGTLTLFYTDGVVESADTAVDAGVRQLASRLDAEIARTRAPREICAALMCGTPAVGARDDRALLAMTCTVGTTLRTATLSLPADPRAARQARGWVRALLDHWGVTGEVVADVALCVSELVTNALIHTSTTPGVSVELDGDRLLVAVTDGGRRGRVEPVVAKDDEVGGRGLAVVAELARAWGVEHRSDGSTVWFEVAPTPNDSVGRATDS